VAGHWHLEDHPSYYACDIKLKGKVPGPVVNFLSKTALKTATSWVKKESEKEPTPKTLAFMREVTPAKQ
jgi:hypothetical protein